MVEAAALGYDWDSFLTGGNVNDRNFLDERRRGLEEAFFVRHNRDLLLKLRDRVDHDESVEQLRSASGLDDEAVLSQLADLGIKAETLVALSLVPLVEVAWADGKIQSDERQALIQAAESLGVLPGSDAFVLLEAWLESRPTEAVRNAWTDYIVALCASTPAEGSREALRAVTLGRAEEIARAAGGILGLGSVSTAERMVLDRLAEAFS